MIVSSATWRPQVRIVTVLLLCGGVCWASTTRLPAADDPKLLSKEERAAAAYERDLKAALQTQQKLSLALQVLLNQDQALRERILATAATAQRQMQVAERLPELTLDRTPPKDGGRKRDRDDDARPEFRVVDQSGARASMAAGAMQLAAMLPTLNASLWRNNAALAKVAADSETTRQQFRGLTDPFGRRSSAEAERAVEIMNDALLANPDNDNARLVLALALVRLGRFAAAERQLSVMADAAGPWQDMALAARGHLRAAGWAGDEPATRRQGAADLNRAVALKSRQPKPLLFRALATWREGKWSQVEPDLKAALRLRPDHLDGLRLLASFYAASPGAERKLEDAEVAARRACELTADQDAGSLEALAAVQARRGEWDAAVETQQKCVAVASGDLVERAERRLGEYQEKKSTDQAPPFVLTEVAVPRLPPADQAVADQLEAMRMRAEPLRPSSWFAERGRFLSLCRKWGPAAANYSRIAQTTPVNEACFNCGCLLWLSGDKTAFQELCQRVSASDTSERAVRLASVTADSGLLPANVLRVALQPDGRPAVNPADPAYSNHGIALAQYRAGMLDEARKLVEAGTDGAELLADAALWKREGRGLNWQLRALIEAREGRFKKARNAAAEARRLIPDAPPQDRPVLGAAPLEMWLEYQVLQVELTDLLDKMP